MFNFGIFLSRTLQNLIFNPIYQSGEITTASTTEITTEITTAKKTGENYLPRKGSGQ